MKWITVLAVGVTALSGSLAHAQSATDDAGVDDMPAGCTLRAKSEYIRLVHCVDGTELEVLASAGKAACSDKIPCGTWIWRRVEDMPLEAPENHDGLNQAQVTSSYGVWVAEDQAFIQISKE